MLRGTDDMTSGVMWSAAAANRSENRDKLTQFMALIQQTIGEKAGELTLVVAKYPQYNNNEFTLKDKDGNVLCVRSVFDGDIVARDPRSYVIDVLASMFAQIGIQFSADDVPGAPAPEVVSIRPLEPQVPVKMKAPPKKKADAKAKPVEETIEPSDGS